LIGTANVIGNLRMKTVQSGLLALYHSVSAAGFLKTAWGRSIFEMAYWFYKRYYEAGTIAPLQQFVKPGSCVVDVGANIGYFTLHFASWVRGGGKVLAIEPEAINYARLQRAVSRAGLTSVVETFRVAAAETVGDGLLEINPMHPGDHKLGTSGVSVAITTIDTLLAGRGWPEVSLLKIDVQGAEARVLAGARETIDRFGPTLLIEVSDDGLRQYGSSAEELILTLCKRQYTIQALKRKGLSTSLSVDEAVTVAKTRGYVDLLFSPASGGHEQPLS
jgi:FkbM family methyltransferase